MVRRKGKVQREKEKEKEKACVEKLKQVGVCVGVGGI